MTLISKNLQDIYNSDLSHKLLEECKVKLLLQDELGQGYAQENFVNEEDVDEIIFSAKLDTIIRTYQWILNDDNIVLQDDLKKDIETFIDKMNNLPNHEDQWKNL